MTRRFLGIDIGGTSARWVTIEDAGAGMARGDAPGATGHLFNPLERERFTATLGQIGDAVGRPVASVGLGVTGFGPRVLSDMRVIVAERFGIEPAAINASDDIELAFRAAFAPGEGHLVSAGTGSIGLHITSSGEVIRVGGRGTLIDDGGSGAWIALRALDLLFRRIDEIGHAGEAGRLADAIYTAVGGDGWDDVREFVYGGDRGRIATLAKPVAEAATAGDRMALGILGEAATELARLARALIARGGHLPVAFVGGVLDLHPMISERLTAMMAGVEATFPKIDAALRAAELAREHQLRNG